MCLHDWRAGRLIRRQVSTANISITPFTIPQDNTRVGLMISVISAMTFGQAASITVDGVLASGLTIGASVYDVSLATHGDLPTREHIVSVIAALTDIGVIELFMPEDYLSAGLNEFISHYSLHRGAAGR